VKSIVCAIIALSLGIPHAPAQSAVLIGVHHSAWDDDKGAHPPGYRTFLITFREGRAQLAAEIPDLIVPRKDGFWRVGAVRKGPPDGDGGYQEFLYAAPVRSVPHALGEYHPVKPDSPCFETDKAVIEFVNPDLLSASYETSPACSLGVEFSHGTYKLDEPAKELDIRAILGPAAWDAERKADAAAKADHAFSDLSNCQGISKVDPANWGIVRSRRLPRGGAKPWALVGDYNTPHVCGDGDTYPINFAIPESLTGPAYHTDALPSLFKSKVAVENQIPGEALLTPAGDFLVTFEGPLYGEAVRVYSVKQRVIEPKPALSVFTHAGSGGGFDVVMVQWALGRHVADWESELQAFQKTYLPEPTVDVGDPQTY
jgi:hypothetical protein